MTDEQQEQNQKETERVGRRLGSRQTDPASRWRTAGAQTNSILLPQEITYPNDAPHHV